MAKRKKQKTYRVVDGTSVRKSNDPASADYDEWLFWEPGDLVSEWPEHADVKGWIESGHWIEEEG